MPSVNNSISPPYNSVQSASKALISIYESTGAAPVSNTAIGNFDTGRPVASALLAALFEADRPFLFEAPTTKAFTSESPGVVTYTQEQSTQVPYLPNP